MHPPEGQAWPEGIASVVELGAAAGAVGGQAHPELKGVAVRGEGDGVGQATAFANSVSRGTGISEQCSGKNPEAAPRCID